MSKHEKKIKVAYVLGALNRGGMESLILDICRCSASTPFEVVCIYRKEGNLSEEFHKTSAHMIHLPREGNILGYMCKLRRMILAEGIDIVHSQTASNTAVLGLSLLGCRRNIVTTIHGFSFLDSNALYKRFVFRLSKRVIFVSNYQMNMYLQKNRIQNKCHVIYNGIDVTKFEADYPMPDIFKESDNLLKLCVIGNFRQARTYEVIIDAIGKLHNEGIRNCSLYIVGDTPNGEQNRLMHYHSLCKQYNIENRVHFVGTRGDIPAILQHIDIYLMSSMETFGISVVEAMMNGKPVIVNDFEVMREISENGNLSLLYATGKSLDLADKIKLVISDINQYKLDAQNRMHYVKQKYSIENHIVQLTKIYTNIS